MKLKNPENLVEFKSALYTSALKFYEKQYEGNTPKVLATPLKTATRIGIIEGTFYIILCTQNENGIAFMLYNPDNHVSIPLSTRWSTYESSDLTSITSTLENIEVFDDAAIQACRKANFMGTYNTTEFFKQ